MNRMEESHHQSSQPGWQSALPRFICVRRLSILINVDKRDGIMKDIYLRATGYVVLKRESDLGGKGLMESFCHYVMSVMNTLHWILDLSCLWLGEGRSRMGLWRLGNVVSIVNDLLHEPLYRNSAISANIFFFLINDFGEDCIHKQCKINIFIILRRSLSRICNR